MPSPPDDEPNIPHFFAIAREMREQLVSRFPKVFTPKNADKMPLKIGIIGDIKLRADDLDEDHLNVGLKDYTSGFKYLMSLVEGAPRFDLDGNPCGKVTKKQAKWALVCLERIRRAKRRRDATQRKLKRQSEPA